MPVYPQSLVEDIDKLTDGYDEEQLREALRRVMLQVAEINDGSHLLAYISMELWDQLEHFKSENKGEPICVQCEDPATDFHDGRQLWFCETCFGLTELFG